MAKKKTTDEPQDDAPVATAGRVRRIRITIKGRGAGLLMSSKGRMDARLDGDGKAAKMETPEEQCRLSCYWTEVDGKPQLALPAVSVYKALVEAGKKFTFKGREKFNKIIAATVSFEEDMIPLGTDQYRHDQRWGKIPPKTGGVVMLHRAHLPEWQATFTMVCDDEFYEVSILKKILMTAGKLIGVLANRPELSGPHGRFDVVEFEILD